MVTLIRIGKRFDWFHETIEKHPNAVELLTGQSNSV
jgi:hypothetical protein